MMTGFADSTAYLEGRSIATLARDHDVSRGAIPVAGLLSERTVADPGALAPELPVVLDMPGKVAGLLRTADLEPAERAALDQGVTVRRGHGYTLRVTAAPAVRRQLLDRCQPPDRTQGTPVVPRQGGGVALDVAGDRISSPERGGVPLVRGAPPSVCPWLEIFNGWGYGMRSHSPDGQGASAS